MSPPRRPEEGRQAPDPGRALSILVIRFRYLGDLVLIQSVFGNLRAAFPAAHITALADEQYIDAVRHMPEVDEALAFPRSSARRSGAPRRLALHAALVRKLRKRRYDFVFDLTDSARSHAVLRVVRARTRVGYEGSGHRSWFWPYDLLVRQFDPAAPHFLDHYLEPLKALGIPIRQHAPVLRASAEDLTSIRAKLEGSGVDPQRFVAVHPGARLAERCWPAACFAEVIDTLATETGLPSVLFGSAGERPLAGEIQAASRSGPVNLAGELSFGELVALLRSCRLFIGNDTGPAHVAAAAGAPLVTLFGMQSPQRWAPVSPLSATVQPSMPCPCPFPSVCEPPNSQKTLCVRRITVPEVLAAARDLLARGDQAATGPG